MMTTMMMIRPAQELGPVLAGRNVAASLRGRVEAALARGEAVVIDFEGVHGMSPSFADELFAKLSVRPDEGGDRIRFEHLRDDLQALMDYVLRGRPNAS
ncbi:MAG: STAS-like domain-containing protein [Chloroflexota bacterium]